MQSTHHVEITDPVGFGTNDIDGKAIFLVAIREGYRLFDSADFYYNADILNEAMRESGIARHDFFINYKILPKLGKDLFLQHVDTVLEKFGFIDCIMLHDMIPSYDGGEAELK